MEKIWIAYFATTEARKRAHADARAEGIDVLAGGVGGQNPNQERPFITFRDIEGTAAQDIQFFSQNGATDVQLI
jgi:hypothetical protein